MKLTPGTPITVRRDACALIAEYRGRTGITSDVVYRAGKFGDLWEINFDDGTSCYAWDEELKVLGPDWGALSAVAAGLACLFLYAYASTQDYHDAMLAHQAYSTPSVRVRSFLTEP